METPKSSSQALSSVSSLPAPPAAPSPQQVIEVVPPDPAWTQAFQSEAQQIQSALGAIAHRIHHIGSTSIPNIYAKPIIDILVEATDLAGVDEGSDALIALGYQVMGEFGIPGRRYFRKEIVAGTRTHHVHIFQIGSPHVIRHLAFRDYMTAHPDAAQAYSELKRSLLAQIDPGDMNAYMDGKDSFVKAMQARAIDWYQATGSEGHPPVPPEP